MIQNLYSQSNNQNTTGETHRHNYLHSISKDMILQDGLKENHGSRGRPYPVKEFCDINSQRNQLTSPHDSGTEYNSSDVPVGSSKEVTKPYGESRSLPEKSLCLKSPLYRDAIKK